MYVIAVYDICTEDKSGKRRIVKIMKKFRQFLHHSQKSVFEGDLSEAKYKLLKVEISKLINVSEDSVFFYRVDNVNNLVRERIGIDLDPVSNFI